MYWAIFFANSSGHQNAFEESLNKVATEKKSLSDTDDDNKKPFFRCVQMVRK
jgi:hypothetical protein